MKRMFLGVVAVVAALSLTACGAASTPAETTENVEEEVYPSETFILGDIISDELVTDDQGTYMRMKVNPEGIAATETLTWADGYAPDPSLGVTDGDLEEAKQVALNWLVHEVIENPAADFQGDEQKAAIDEWLDAQGDDMFVDSWRTWNRDSFYRTFSNVNYPTVRDGKPRLDGLQVEYPTLPEYSPEANAAFIYMDVTRWYRVPSTWFQETAEYFNGDDTNGITKDDAIASFKVTTRGYVAVNLDTMKVLAWSQEVPEVTSNLYEIELSNI